MNEFLGGDHFIISIQLNHVQPTVNTFLPRRNFSKAQWLEYSRLCEQKLSYININCLAVSQSYPTFEATPLEAAYVTVTQTKSFNKISVPGGTRTAKMPKK